MVKKVITAVGSRHITAVVTRLHRAIHYSRDSRGMSRSVLDTRMRRYDDLWCGDTVIRRVG
jgi:hypothetical protein